MKILFSYSFCESENFTSTFQPDAATKLPILVFIHGGGFSARSSSSKAYDPQPFMLSGGVIVVTLNYRLGILGKLCICILYIMFTSLCSSSITYCTL